MLTTRTRQSEITGSLLRKTILKIAKEKKKQLNKIFFSNSNITSMLNEHQCFTA
jgi:hypothetical protein